MAMIGLKVPEDICDELSRISVPGKKTKLDEYHITMFYFGDKLKIEETTKIVESLYEVIRKSDPIQIKGRTISSFKRGDDGIPIIVPIVSEDLIELREKIAKKFDTNGIQYNKKWPEYKPHITLSYSPKEFEDRKIDKNISWKAREIIFWAGEWHSDPGIVVELPLMKKASRSELVQAQLFESLVRFGVI